MEIGECLNTATFTGTRASGANFKNLPAIATISYTESRYYLMVLTIDGGAVLSKYRLLFQPQ